MSDWGFSPNVSRFGGDDAGSGKTTVTGSGSANTKGSWSALFATTGFEAGGLIMQIQFSTGVRSALIDIGIGGAGSEVVLVPNVFVYGNVGYALIGSFFIPMYVPAGSRISARLQSNATSADFYMKSQLVATNQRIVGQRATDYGSTTATSLGTTITTGAGSKGSYAQLTASCEVVSHALLCFGDSPPGAADFYLDLAVGGSGSEVVVIPDFYLTRNVSTVNALTPVFLSLPLSIPAGSRISARARSASAITLSMNMIGIGP